MAERTGWDKSRISRYENNQVGLSIDAIEEIAGALELPSLMVVVECLKHIYPDLANPKSQYGSIMARLTKELKKDLSADEL